MTDLTPQTTPTRDEAVLREICEELLDKHHGRQAPGEVDAPSFGRGAAAGWDAAVSAFYKAAVDRVNRATDAEMGGVHRSFAPAPAPASAVDAVVVKALQWREEETDWWSAEVLTWKSGYEAWKSPSGTVRWRVPGDAKFSLFDGTLDEAKAACEAAYDKLIRSALSPAATPGSEAGGAAFRVTKRGAFVQHEPLLPAFDLPDGTYDLHLAKPASSPAGGDVVRCLATGNPVGTDTWQVGRPCRCANCSPLSQPTSAGRVGE